MKCSKPGAGGGGGDGGKTRETGAGGACKRHQPTVKKGGGGFPKTGTKSREKKGRGRVDRGRNLQKNPTKNPPRKPGGKNIPPFANVETHKDQINQKEGGLMWKAQQGGKVKRKKRKRFQNSKKNKRYEGVKREFSLSKGNPKGKGDGKWRKGEKRGILRVQKKWTVGGGGYEEAQEKHKPH